MSDNMNKLKSLLAEIEHIDQALAVLGWDRETYMPPGGSQDRANQIATLTRIRHARFTSDEMGRLLDDLSSEVGGRDPDGDEARIVQVVKRDYDLQCKLPPALVEDVTRATATGIDAWRKAREANDYSIFEPAMKRNADLNLQQAEALGYKERPYDALVDRYEPGMTTSRLETIFSELRGAITPLVRGIHAHASAADDSCLHQQFDPATQLSFARDISRLIGYDAQRGRLDLSPHPFCTSFGLGDVRITTRVWPDFLNAALFAVMHESGHAMYEQGISPSLQGTSLDHGASAGVHESQSRLWENLVGRSRPFQDFLFPRLKKTYPQQLGSVDVEAFYRAVNKVQPSFIRVEADEVTYNLHIMMRFDLENEMLAGKVDIAKLDEAWNERMEHYLGIVPPDALQGVLQDIHWSGADSFGVFPGYALGNIIGTQLFAQARKEMPDLDGRIASGDLGGLLGWLQEKLYKHGRKFMPDELMQRITGKPIGTQAWISYVQGKYSQIYGL